MSNQFRKSASAALTVSAILLATSAVALFSFDTLAAENASPSPLPSLGPFTPSPAFSLYWLNRAGNCTASLRLQTTTAPENVFIRAYDVSKASMLSETMTFRQYISLPSGTIQTIPLTLAATPSQITEIRVSAGGNHASISVLSNCAVSNYGVSYQNGDFTGWGGMPSALFAFVPFRAEALSIQNESSSTISVTGVDAAGVQSNVIGPQNGPIIIAAVSSPPAPRSLIPQYVSWQGDGRSNVIWQFGFSTSSWKFRAGGFPLILCSNQAAANVLAAGTFVSGSDVLSHVLQYDLIANVIPRLASMVGTTSQLQEKLQALLTPPLLKSPNYFLLSVYGPIYDLANSLGSQNLIKGSAWLGSSDGWQSRDPASSSYAGDTVAKPSSPSVSYVRAGSTLTMPLLDATRPNRLGPVSVLKVSSAQTAPAMQTGASDDDGTATQGLGMLALLNGAQSPVPFNNPFFRNKALLYRAALAALRDLSNLQEDEIWHYDGTDLDSYPGGEAAFISARKIFPNYGMIGLFMRRVFCASAPTSSESTVYNCSGLPSPISASELSGWAFSSDEIVLWKQAFADWTNLLHRYAYRMYPNNLVGARNQSAHYLLAFQMLADGSGDPFDVSLAKQYAARWIAGQDPAGWIMEAAGPDGSYVGMQDFHVAAYYLDTCLMANCDTSMATSLAKNYTFFNYTVAPEPIASPTAVPQFLGGFPFNHRVGSPFSTEQFAGARGIANDIPEVSAWNATYLGAPAPATLPPSINPAKDERLDFNSSRYFGVINRPQVKPTPWPASSETDFTIDVNGAGEMIAVKRASYYTSLYLAHPASSFDIREANNPNERLAWLSDGESRGCNIGDPHYWNAPFVGGGVTLFWTPDFGSSVIAGNWTPLAHHGLILTDGTTGVRSWEDYFSASYSMPDPNHLNAVGNIESMASQLQPVVSGVVNPTPNSSPACLVNNSGTGAKSNISGLSYSRNYVFAEHAMIVTTTVFSAPNANLPAGSTMIENIPIAAGTIKASSTGAPQFHLPGSVVPIINERIITGATEIDVYAANAKSGLRIRFGGAPTVEVISNGPNLLNALQINRLQINSPIAASGGSSSISYCLQRLSDNPRDCGF